MANEGILGFMAKLKKNAELFNGVDEDVLFKLAQKYGPMPVEVFAILVETHYGKKSERIVFRATCKLKKRIEESAGSKLSEWVTFAILEKLAKEEGSIKEGKK